MKYCLAAILFSMSGCAAGQVIWPHIVTCAVQAASPLMSQISTILLGGGDVASQLETLAKTQGVDVVACIVNQLVNQWSAPGAMKVSPEQEMAAARGRAFLASHGVNVE